MNRLDPEDPTTEDAVGSSSLPRKLASLRFKLGQKAKQEPEFRFYALYGHLMRVDVLQAALSSVAAKRGDRKSVV